MMTDIEQQVIDCLFNHAQVQLRRAFKFPSNGYQITLKSHPGIGHIFFHSDYLMVSSGLAKTKIQYADPELLTKTIKHIERAFEIIYA